ncbi:MAG: iron-sulfur cluster assembly protein [Candidatus Marinimicrobia bacterium]|nr:iron-sulfur cluster assembly protein [Candidatus Neomarinimicrobiota bacterium]
MPELDLNEIKEKIVSVIKGIYDPEIPVNIYDLGLIYDITVTEELEGYVKMTLTAPNCPVAGSLPISVKQQILQEVPELEFADVEVVWEPQWHKDMISEAGLLQLGLL